MAEELMKSGIFFDELNTLRVLEPDIANQTNELKDECKIFVEKITEFHKIADGFIAVVEHLAKNVEKEKMKAMGARNLLQSVAKQRETEQQQLQALILEKSFELERLKIHYSSLQRIELERQETIDHLLQNK